MIKFGDDFNKNFILSLVVHTIFFLFAFFGGRIISETFKNNDIEIIQAAVRVDVVGMPKFTYQELKKMEPPPAVKEVIEKNIGEKEAAKTESDDIIKKGDLVIQEKSKKKSSFLNILNNYSSKKISNKEARKGEKSGIGDKNLDALIIEGNRISKGAALIGDYSDEKNSEFSAYVQNIPAVIRPNWKLPSYLMEKNLRCRIKIFLSSGGKLIKLELLESSGISEFDARAERAIRSSDFPIPPKEVGGRLVSSGIILGFPL